VRSFKKAIADTRTEAPPLRRPAPAQRVLIAVLALAAIAISLFAVSDVLGGRRPSPVTPKTAGEAVPRYYVQLDSHLEGGPAVRYGLLVGDTLTGQTVTTVQAPPGGSFLAVAGAVDDRTFVVLAGPASGTPGPAPGMDTSSPLPGTAESWYLLRLAPGTASPARLTPIPGKPVAGVLGMALSGSGRELAVTAAIGNQVPWLGIYSVATGRLLRAWSVAGTPPFQISSYSAVPAWIDGDQAIGFVAGTPGSPNGQTVRRLDIEIAGGDLATDSRTIWSTPPVSRDQQGPPCELLSYPPVSTDGQTVVCMAPTPAFDPDTAIEHLTMRWMGYPVAARTAPQVLNQVSTSGVTGPENGAVLTTLWVSPSGATIIVEWGEYASLPGIPGTATMLHFGVASHGTFRLLKAPPFSEPAFLSGQPSIAW